MHYSAYTEARYIPRDGGGASVRLAGTSRTQEALRDAALERDPDLFDGLPRLIGGIEARLTADETLIYPHRVPHRMVRVELASERTAGWLPGDLAAFFFLAAMDSPRVFCEIAKSGWGDILGCRAYSAPGGPRIEVPPGELGWRWERGEWIKEGEDARPARMRAPLRRERSPDTALIAAGGNTAGGPQNGPPGVSPAG